MADREKHYPQCENATSRKCECGWCSGALHGWTGAIKLVRDPDPKEREKFARKVWTKWTTELGKWGKKKIKYITLGHKAAAVDLARVDLVMWLADDRIKRESGGSKSAKSGQGVSLREVSGGEETSSGDVVPSSPQFPSDDGTSPVGDRRLPVAIEPAIVDQVESIGDALYERVLEKVADEYGGEIPDQVKKALADHLWCDVLARTAQVIAEGLKRVDSVPDRIADLVMSSREEDKRKTLEKALVKSLVKNLWSTVQDLTFAGALVKGRAALPVIRVLAILICKSPERHKAVVEHCVKPLEDQLQDATKEKLLEAFGDWVAPTG